MECTTIWNRPKKKFNTLDEAITEAKKINALPQTITKKIAYKCKLCCKFHIGSNGKSINK